MKGPKPIDQALKEKLEDLEKIKGLKICGRKLQIAIRLSAEEVEKIMSLEGETFRKKLSGFISSSLVDVTSG